MQNRNYTLMIIAILAMLLALPVNMLSQTGMPEKGELLYENPFSSSEDVNDWVMEGPGEITFQDGWMHMQSPDEEYHHVFWCPEEFPDQYIAEWEAQNLETDAGLCIVFFAAKGLNGEDIFDPSLPERDGEFTDYTKGQIRNYHISYYANAPHNPDRGQSNLRKNNGFALVQTGNEGIPTNSTDTHQITLVKNGAHIMMFVDERKVIDWVDTEENEARPPHKAGKIGFRQMQWTHFKYRNFKVHAIEQNMETFLQKHIDNLHNADEIPGREDSYTDSAIATYKERTLESIYNNSKGLFNEKPHWKADPDRYGKHDINGKSEMNDILATLIQGDGTHKRNAKNMLYNVMLFTQKSRDFTSYRVNYLLNKYPDVFTSEKENDLKQFYATNQNNAWGDDLWAYNTENKCQMYRSTPYGIGLKWPQSSFIVREGVEDDEENGAYMSNQIEEKHIKPYFRYLLKYGMGENLSPTYMSHHLSPWTVFYELARVHDRQTAMDLSGGILDYYYTLAGLHYRHKTYIGTVNRARPASINDNHGFTEHSQMFGGFPPDGNFKPTHHATIPSSDYNPRMQTRRIIAGDIRMPYSLMQTCGINGWFQRQVVISDKGHSGNYFNSDYARTIFRYSYVHRQFSIGTGNIKVLPGDNPDYVDGIAGSAAWDNGFMVFSSPKRHANKNWGNKFFRDRKAGYSGNVGADSWVGYSPYMEMAQFENTAIVYCVIPSDETHRLAQVHVSAPKQSELLEKDDNRQTWYGKYKAREGFVYFAFIPLHYSEWNIKSTGFKNMERLVDDGAEDGGHCGYVVEMAHSSEITFDEFKNRANRSNLVWNQSNATIKYRNMKGDSLLLKHSSNTDRHDKLPDIHITPFKESPIAIDWEKYPTLRSPYMRVIEEDNREKLVVNDNKSGFKLDFDGNNVHYFETDDYLPDNYTSFDLPKLDTFSIAIWFRNDKGKPVTENTEIKMNGISYYTDSAGYISVTLPEGSYKPIFPGEKYQLFDDVPINVKSDSNYTIQLKPISYLRINVVNKNTHDPVNRALVSYNTQKLLTGDDGMVDYGKFTGDIAIDISVEHEEYFNHRDTLYIESDTVVEIALTPTYANVTFQVSDNEGPVYGASVNFGEMAIPTNSDGQSDFYRRGARTEYVYSVEAGGYKKVLDTVFIETDTTIEVTLDKAVAIDEKNLDEISIYPNPFYESIRFEVNQKGELHVYDLLGNLHYNGHINKGLNIIRLDEMIKGVYLMKITMNEKVFTYKLLKR